VEKYQFILSTLFRSAQQETFRGYDPYDGLHVQNSWGRFLLSSSLSRLLLIHLNKRLIFNIRPLLGVHKGVNPKGVALFLSGLIRQNHLEEATALAETLINMNTRKARHTAWGYYFPWQSRAFFLPADTPNIVTTCFVASALLDLHEAKPDGKLLEVVKDAIEFIINELNRYEDESGICFSYSPLDDSVIYNASAFGLELIARFQHITGHNDDKRGQLLEKGVRFLKAAQNPDGSWFYGKQLRQHFIDHYHTAYILESLENIRRYTNDRFGLDEVISEGLDFYLTHLFTNDHAPKFYKNSLYPIESHCCGAAIKALCLLSAHYGASLLEQAVRVAQWAIDHLYDSRRGFFYYQKRKFWTNKIKYLRWSQSWMYVGLSYLIDYAGKN